MEFPRRVLRPRRFQPSRERYASGGSNAAPAPPAPPNLRYKLATLVDRNEKVKIAYNQLHTQITFGLVEAGDVFESLEIPLMKLVGLKTSQMESEGRYSTFVFNSQRNHMNTAQNGTRADDLNNQIRRSKDENYAAKAELAGKEILQKHKGQLGQLVHMLKHIELQVNAHQDDILQMIDHRRTFFQKFFQKAFCGLSSVHSQNRETFPVTVKLLKVLFNNINELLGSVDSGVNDLMEALAKNMCNPMTKYVGKLAAEIKTGPCVPLMNVVNEMERKNVDTKRELQDAKERIRLVEEDARERIRLAEEAKFDALSRLKKAEDQVGRMAKTSRFLLPASQQKQAGGYFTSMVISRKQAEHSITGKRLGIEGRLESEEKIRWDLLRKKRKLLETESPVGPREQKPLVCNRRMTRSQTRLSSKMTLGVSPSAGTVNWR